MNVLIDDKSGCCNGVLRALNEAEKHLASRGRLYSLGAIVHNGVELKRLEEQGLEIIDYNDFENLTGGDVLIRAHGEPPQTYLIARNRNLNIIDCTCPVVLKLQRRIAESHCKMKEVGGSVIIFGKRGHAEVNGLVGQVSGDAFVVESIEQMSSLIDSGSVNLQRPISIFSQTTKDPDQYSRLCEYIKGRIGDGPALTINDTICRQVSSRYAHLVEFSKRHSVVLFVSGKESSNGKILFELCKGVNPRSYMITDASEIDLTWFKDDDNVGICGATSTPKWQLEEIFIYLHAQKSGSNTITL